MYKRQGYLEENYGQRHSCHELADKMVTRFGKTSIESIFDYGLHEFIVDFLRDSNMLGQQIEQDFRFIE